MQRLIPFCKPTWLGKLSQTCKSTLLDHWCKYESLVIGKVKLSWVIESCTSLKNMFEDSAWTQGEHGKFSAHQIYRAHRSTREEKTCFGPPFALDFKGGEYHGVWKMLRLMYLYFVVIKHHRGFHQVQRGRLLAIWCNMLSLMVTYLMKLSLMESYLMSFLLIATVFLRCKNGVSTGQRKCDKEKNTSKCQKNETGNISQCIRKFYE